MGKMAETANQYLKKGSKAMLEGRLVLEQWTDSTTGQARSKHSLRVETMKMLDSKVATNNTQENQPYQTNYAIQQTQAQQLQQNVNQASQMQGSLIDENDEIPF
jgi:single-strand DNA-binding protein